MRYQNHFSENDLPYKESFRDISAPFMNHCHKEFEIIHIRKGSMKLVCHEEIYILEEGEIAIIPPYICHATFPQPSKECERFVIVLGMGVFTNTVSFGTENFQLYQQEFYTLQTFSRHWTPSAYSKVKTLIYNMHEEYKKKENAWEFAIATFANLLMLTAIRSFPKRETPLLENTTESVAFQKVMTYIADNYESKITLDECAKLCNFNPSYFSRYFKKHMGTTFQDYVKKSRIEQAKWLLLSTNTTITNIAFQCGFSSLCTFSKIFKQETGMPASSYRKI